MFNTPILFIIFNRLETTKQVFAQIKNVQPNQLFISADGPRNDKEGEKEKCDKVRQWVLEQIDWNCEVKTLFRAENLGCGKGPASAIDWFFQNVERGIILEDDCLPNNSFFVFCETMLMRFENDSNIMHISGNNFQLSQIGNESYYLSKLPYIWGWATWRRAWEKYDFELTVFEDTEVCNYFNYKSIDDYWHDLFRKTKNESSTVWDCQWVFTILHNNGFCILPQNNLVKNIGFGEDSTHTSDKGDYFASMKSYELEISMNNKDLFYDSLADINFHKLFKWEIIEEPKKNITAKEAIKTILTKINSKIRIGKS